MTPESRCESFQRNGVVAASFIIVFSAVLLLFGPFFALVFALLAMCISAISHEIRLRRRFRLAAEQRSIERRDNIVSLGRVPALRAVPKPYPDLSALVVRTFHNDDTMFTCEICLEDAQEGDELASSPNKDCIHEFHADCIRQSLLRLPTCPCCRRDFFSPHDAVIAPTVTDEAIPQRVDSTTEVQVEEINDV